MVLPATLCATGSEPWALEVNAKNGAAPPVIVTVDAERPNRPSAPRVPPSEPGSRYRCVRIVRRAAVAAAGRRRAVNPTSREG